VNPSLPQTLFAVPDQVEVLPQPYVYTDTYILNSDDSLQQSNYFSVAVTYDPITVEVHFTVSSFDEEKKS